MPSNATIATLRRPRGVRGEIVATPLSDFPERFAKLNRVFAGERELEVERSWWHGADVVFKFRGIDSPEAARELNGLDIEIPVSERVPLPEGEYYLADLIGCVVYDRGERLGEVTGWQELPGQRLIEVGAIEIPTRLLSKIDLAARRIDAELPEGLRELNS
ncbi:MAG: ribosome maturation factor RimM [Bryobacteraceae bacterium]|nr:ribosome maturation factor RimM [Bryobacteraceae bacterium]